MENKSTATTYIVSGWPRSGTSREMEALIAGGLEAVWNPYRSKVARWASDMDFKVNDDLYELSAQQYGETGFPRKHEGKLIKVIGETILRMVPGNYRIVFLHRDARARARSFLAAFGKPSSGEDYPERFENVTTLMKLRPDCEISEAHFEGITVDPLTHYRALADNGWPIDPEKAASVIDPARVRF